MYHPGFCKFLTVAYRITDKDTSWG